jgi:hypothetical protein
MNRLTLLTIAALICLPHSALAVAINQPCPQNGATKMDDGQKEVLGCFGGVWRRASTSIINLNDIPVCMDPQHFMHFDGVNFHCDPIGPSSTSATSTSDPSAPPTADTSQPVTSSNPPASNPPITCIGLSQSCVVNDPSAATVAQNTDGTFSLTATYQGVPTTTVCTGMAVNATGPYYTGCN